MPSQTDQVGPNSALSSNDAFISASITLTLGILGSSILPVPWAVSRLGVVPAITVAFFVGAANWYTGCLLLRMAQFMHCDTYESVCESAGGKRCYRIIAQLSLMALLFGTLAGDAALLADTGVLSVEDFFRQGTLPSWLENNNGRVEMLFLITFLVFPLSLTKRIRELEKVATAGLVLVALLLFVVAKATISKGFPALVSGELPLFTVAEKKDIPEAVAVLSFAFYLQPMLLPLLSEMPPGSMGVNLTSKALKVVTFGVATVVYLLIGILAASRYGIQTEGDFLVNSWSKSNIFDGLLDSMTAVYLALSMAPMAMTLRYQLDSVANKGHLASSYVKSREVGFTALILGSSTAVAFTAPTAAEKIFSVTGATAVCLVCYVLPVLAHLALVFRSTLEPPVVIGIVEEEERLLVDTYTDRPTVPLLHREEVGIDNDETMITYPKYKDDIGNLQGIDWLFQVGRHIGIPVLVMCVGTGFCASALILSLSAW